MEYLALAVWGPIALVTWTFWIVATAPFRLAAVIWRSARRRDRGQVLVVDRHPLAFGPHRRHRADARVATRGPLCPG